MTYVTVTLKLRTRSLKRAAGIAEGAAEHLLETFNDDGSVVEAWHRVSPTRRTVWLLHTWTRHDPNDTTAHMTRESAERAARDFLGDYDGVDLAAAVREMREGGGSFACRGTDDGCRIEECEVQS
jgi:hypothetical protein